MVTIVLTFHSFRSSCNDINIYVQKHIPRNFTKIYFSTVSVRCIFNSIIYFSYVVFLCILILTQQQIIIVCFIITSKNVDYWTQASKKISRTITDLILSCIQRLLVTSTRSSGYFIGDLPTLCFEVCVRYYVSLHTLKNPGHVHTFNIDIQFRATPFGNS